MWYKIGGGLLILAALLTQFWPSIKGAISRKKKIATVEPSLSELIEVEQAVPNEVAWCYLLAELGKDRDNGTIVSLAQQLYVEITNLPDMAEAVSVDEVKVV